MKSDDEIFRERQSKEGKKGGQKTLSLYGKKHFSDIARESWQKGKRKKKKKNA